ncbi:MAG: hypothetical protein K6D91_03570 [Prevotella sp.]|nr:hypothetical protein [Prevotella sp.]
MRKHFFRYFICLITLCTYTACSQDDDESDPFYPNREYQRTVLVYISGENRLCTFINGELKEMCEGSKKLNDSQALVVYVDNASSSEKPFLARIENGALTDRYDFVSDSLSSDPCVMSNILNYVSHRYPANEYGLVLWGHGSGWLKEDSIANSRRAYGIDNGNNTYTDVGPWINIPTLAEILRKWGHQLRFILNDCCYAQCIESAYELRHVADYIIGSPAEIPGIGAPYDQLTPTLFGTTPNFYEDIVNSYFNQTITIKVNANESYIARVALSVIKTSELPSLANATRLILDKIDLQNSQKLNGLLYYGMYEYLPEMRMVDTFYDINDFFLNKADTEDYNGWKEVFDRAVVYRVYDKWQTLYLPLSNFDLLSEQRYGGVSMYVPQQRTNTNFYNVCAEYIKNYEWYYAAGLSSLEHQKE